MTKSEPTTVLCHIIVFCWCCRYYPKLNFYVKSFALIMLPMKKIQNVFKHMLRLVFHTVVCRNLGMTLYSSQEKKTLLKVRGKILEVVTFMAKNPTSFQQFCVHYCENRLVSEFYV